MTRRRKLFLGLIAVGLALAAGAGWWWYAWSPPPSKFVLRGSSGTNGPLGVSGGNLVVVTPRPGLFFGTVRKPGGQEEFTYLVLFRYGRPGAEGSGRGIQFHCTSDGRSAETKDAIELDGRRLEAAYRVELDEKRAAVAKETVAINGDGKDLAAGRVFLVDLTAEPPACRQKKAELPAIPSKLETPEDMERLADAVRKSLEGQDPEIQAFLR